ncbi:MAG: hypothetical protein D6820_13015 [Lentisphaerae bacterium]|nr:MAG: hypothetical protein D6820_13015 [Lentisphaerota bacterium]
MNWQDFFDTHPSPRNWLDHPLFEIMRDGVALYMCTSNGRRKVVACNHAYCLSAGLSREEILAAEDIGEYQESDFFSTENTHMLQSFSTQTPCLITYRWKRPDRQVTTIEAQLVPVHHEHQLYLFSLERDITEQQHVSRYLGNLQQVLEEKVKRRTIELAQARQTSETVAQRLQQTVCELEIANRKLKDAQARIIMQEKLASVGELAAGLAHELNNPIVYLQGNFEALTRNSEILIDMLRQTLTVCECVKNGELPSPQTLHEIDEKARTLNLDFILQDMQELFLESKEGFRRIRHIIDSMREFSRPTMNDNLEPVNLNHEIATTINIVNTLHKAKIQFKTELEPIPEVMAYPGQINQVILNLLINAIQAIQEYSDKNEGWLRRPCFAKMNGNGYF